jgi:hypothetical protein
VTLIISVLTDEYVALVSDRRITWREVSTTKRQEDSDIKTFNLYGQFIMGFTGLARIDNLRMEAWVSKVLNGVPSSEYFIALREEIEKAFSRLGYTGEIPHAFLAAGYSPISPGGRMYPLSIAVSNSTDRDDHFPSQEVSSKFKIYLDPLGNRRHAIYSAGWPVHDTTRRALEHRVRVVSKGDASNPRLVVMPLVMAMRDTARRSREHVGRSVLFTSLPRCAAPDPGVAVGESVDFHNRTASIYLPEDARNTDDSIFYAPACISPQMHIMGLRVYSGGPISPPREYPEGYPD